MLVFWESLQARYMDTGQHSFFPKVPEQVPPYILRRKTEFVA
jgi:hypothetical protein